MRKIALFSLALALLCIVPVSAETPTRSAAENVAVPADDPIAHYRLYEAAIARGDTVAASDAAVLAWQTGERVWNGRNPNLPGLAFNAAWALGLANKITQAQEPARRALVLAAQYPGSVEVKEAAFLQAYSEMMVAPSRTRIDAFNIAAKAVDNGGWGDFLLSRAYLDGSRIALETSMPRVSREFSDRGLVEVSRVAPNNDGLRTNFLIMRTQSSLQTGEYAQAVREVMDARRAYGAPKSERDLNWAALLAWEGASRAIFQSVRPTYSSASRLPRSNSIPEWDKEELKTLNGGPVECRDLEFERRGPKGPQGIAFPDKEQRDMYAGGAYIRAQLSADGKVIATDIRSALPRPAFGTAAEQGIRRWQYDIPAGTPEVCRFVNVLVMYAFR